MSKTIDLLKEAYSASCKELGARHPCTSKIVQALQQSGAKNLPILLRDLKSANTETARLLPTDRTNRHGRKLFKAGSIPPAKEDAQPAKFPIDPISVQEAPRTKERETPKKAQRLKIEADVVDADKVRTLNISALAAMYNIDQLSEACKLAGIDEETISGKSGRQLAALLKTTLK